MRRGLLAGMLTLAMVVAAPAVAQAFPEYWEMKSGLLWGPLPNKTPEYLTMTGTFALTGGKSGIDEYKSTCTANGVMRIENEEPVLGYIEGLDQVEEFAGGCAQNGGTPWPCVSNEPWSFSAVHPGWESELIPGYDIFSQDKLLVYCITSGLSAQYKTPGGIAIAKLGTNKLAFPYSGGMPFRHPPYFFYLWGKVKLQSHLPYSGVR
jgi:hypothetical protein